MAQKVPQAQALLAGAGIGKGRDGDNGFHSGQRGLGPVGTMLLALGQAPDPLTSFHQPWKQNHLARGVAGYPGSPARLPAWSPPSPGARRTVLSPQGEPLKPALCPVRPSGSWASPP